MAVLRLATSARDAAADAIVDLIDAGAGAGLLKIYNGSMPATPNDAVTSQTLLATLTFSDPAFTASSGGTTTASAISDDTAADATGTAAWARIIDSTGAAVMDVDVGTAGATLNLNTTSVVIGAVVRVTSAAITMPVGA